MSGIENYLNFDKREQHGREKIRESQLKGKPVKVLSWEILKSRFTNSESGLYCEIVLQFLDEDVEWIFCTGSDVVREQLQGIEKAKRKNNETDLSFHCRFIKDKRYWKMVPVEG